MANDRITRTATADGFTLTCPDLTDPNRLPITATITHGDDAMSTIVIADITGEAADPLEVPTIAVDNIARRMLAIYGA